jgi:predicted nucleic acid-binding Zn ribbon protein
MPIYEYKCECSPNSIRPKERSINSIEPTYLCSDCGKRLQRHYGSFGIQFKGNGFYKTDNPK